MKGFMAISSVSANQFPVNYNQNLPVQDKQTHTGLVAGAILSLPVIMNSIDTMCYTPQKQTDKYDRLVSYLKQRGYSVKDYDDVCKFFKASNKKLPLITAVTVASFIGSGVIIDYLRNKNSKAVYKQIQDSKINNNIIQDKNIVYTKTGNAYYKSNEGSKWGGILGLLTGCVLSVISYKNFDKLFDSMLSVLSALVDWPEFFSSFAKISPKIGVASTIALCGLGGWITGKVTDMIVNKKAHNKALNNQI